MIKSQIHLDTNFSGSSDPTDLVCAQMQAQLRRLLASYPDDAEINPDTVLNQAADILGNADERYCRIYLCEECGRLYHTENSTSDSETHDFCSHDCQETWIRRENAARAKSLLSSLDESQELTTVVCLSCYQVLENVAKEDSCQRCGCRYDSHVSETRPDCGSPHVDTHCPACENTDVLYLPDVLSDWEDLRDLDVEIETELLQNIEQFVQADGVKADCETCCYAASGGQTLVCCYYEGPGEEEPHPEEYCQYYSPKEEEEKGP